MRAANLVYVCVRVVVLCCMLEVGGLRCSITGFLIGLAKVVMGSIKTRMAEEGLLLELPEATYCMLCKPSFRCVCWCCCCCCSLQEGDAAVSSSRYP